MPEIETPQNSSEVLQTRITKDLKKGLRLFCAMNDLTIQEAVQQALTLMLSDKSNQSQSLQASSA